jgi:hypothetical protein
MKPRTILLVAILFGAAGGALPLIKAARLGQLSPSMSFIAFAGIGGALIAGAVVLAALHNLPLMLRLARDARLLTAGALALLLVIALVARAFGVQLR